MFKKITLLLAVSVMLAACASTHPWVQPASSQSVPLPSSDKAQIVFLRPSTYFPVMVTLLYEINASGDKFISPIGGTSKVVYNTEPGEKLFMSNNGVMSHFMTANIEAGKRYYVLVRPIHGYGFQLRPIRNSAKTDYNTTLPEFPLWLANTSIVEASMEAEPAITKHQDGFSDTQKKGFLEWQAKSADQLSELTLTPEDAVAL